MKFHVIFRFILLFTLKLHQKWGESIFGEVPKVIRAAVWRHGDYYVDL